MCVNPISQWFLDSSVSLTINSILSTFKPFYCAGKFMLVQFLVYLQRMFKYKSRVISLRQFNSYFK